MWLLILYLCLQTLVLSLAQDSALPRVQINGQQLFESEDGRIRIFHGTSFVDKGLDLVHVTDEQMDIFKNRWGMNFARVGILWDLVEPTPGVYNTTYINQMVDLLNRFHKHGIYTMLDMHQDVWARQYCGHGFPDFYSMPPDDPRYRDDGGFAFPRPVASPKPHQSDCSALDSSPIGWVSGYVTFALSAGVQRLYDNKDGYLSKFGDFWQMIASKTTNMTGNVGYELINEPWMGDIWNDLTLLIPGVGDHKNMEPAYEYLHKRIRTVDNDSVIFYESGYAGNFFDAVGFKKGVGGEDYKDRRALSYHMYCPMLQADLNVNGSLWRWLYNHLGWTTDVDCSIALGVGVANRQRDVARLGGGGLLTEFGALPSDLEFGGDAANFLMNEMDSRVAGWVYWAINPSEDTEKNYPKLVKILSRTYAQAIAGKPKSIKFDPETATFKLVYKPSKESVEKGLATEIFANRQIMYPNGFEVKIDPQNAASYSYNEQNGIISVKHHTSALLVDELTVTVTKK